MISENAFLGTLVLEYSYNYHISGNTGPGDIYLFIARNLYPEVQRHRSWGNASPKSKDTYLGEGKLYLGLLIPKNDVVLDISNAPILS